MASDAFTARNCPTVIRMGEMEVLLRNRWEMRDLGRMIDEGKVVVVHEKWCPVATAAGKPLCFCTPQFGTPRRRRARATA